MIIHKKSSQEISIVFNELSFKRKWIVLRNILKSFPKQQNYFFELCGIEVERFLEDIDSKDYVLINDNVHKIFKDLPKLYLKTNNLQDVEMFSKYSEYFNEGGMTLYLLNKQIKPKLSICNIKELLNYVYENNALSVDIVSDGEEFEVYSCIPRNIDIIYKLLIEGNQGTVL